MKKTSQSGFTLIELLVVIAIIGILASIVLASLNTARNKGADAAIKAQLANARAQGEIYYGIGNTYAGVCTTPATGSGVQDLVQASMKNYNGTTTVTTAIATAGTPTTAVCHDSLTGWAAAVPLKAPTITSPTNGVYCVDSTGKSLETVVGVAANAVVCS